jgi:hypothetical protein
LKTRRLLLEMDAKKARMVEKVSLRATVTANAAILQMLDLVSPYVKNLHFLPAQIGQLMSYESIETKMIDNRLSLPNLTHLHLFNSSIQYAAFLYVIFNAAPSLTSADLDMNYSMPLLPGQEEGPEFTLHTIQTKLRSLQISVQDIENLTFGGRTRTLSSIS